MTVTILVKMVIDLIRVTGHQNMTMVMTISNPGLPRPPTSAPHYNMLSRDVSERLLGITVFHGSQWFFGWPFPPLVELVVYPLFTLSFVGGFGVGFKVGTKLHLLAIATAIELFRMTFVADPFAFAYANTWIYAVGTGVEIAQVSRQTKLKFLPISLT